MLPQTAVLLRGRRQLIEGYDMPSSALIPIEIVNLAAVDDSFGQVRLVKGTAAPCYLEGTAAVPNREGGFDVLVDSTDSRALQKAGRTIGSLGLTKVAVTLADDLGLELTDLAATQLIIGLYSEPAARVGLTVALELKDAVLQAVRRDVTFITLGRIFANSSNNQYHTIDLVQTYYQQLQEAFFQFGKEYGGAEGKLSFKLYMAGDELFDQNCVGLQTVGNSAQHQPCLGVIDYVGPNAKDDVVDIVLVGKGIAFDSGGYDLKPSKFMETMRTDKSGLIYVAAATMLAAAMGAHKHLRCYLPCCENRVSSSAMVPGDIITYPNKVTVEIGNTDAEGRLILADALLLGCKDQPKFILDAATLTGAAKIAIGRDMCAILCRESKLDDQLTQAFDYTKEEYWQLPLKEYHKRYITAKRADISNTSHGDGAPGASTAAAFLSFFVDSNIKWAHLDLANAYQQDNSPYLASGSTGNTILALAHWLVGAQY